MSINIKKYTKDQMAKMVEEAAERLESLKRENADLIEKLRKETASKKDVTDLRNKLAESEKELSEHRAATVRRLDELKKQLADTEAALGRANAELTHSVAEKNALRNDVTKMTDRAAFECGRADYAETHPWRNLWSWLERKLKMA